MLRCVAIDDEPIALSIIGKYCDMYGDIDLRCFENPAEGIAYVRQNPPDILFLDIEMHPVNGLEIAAGLPKEVCLIFTTAYAQYAIDGFELNAIDYIQKPLLFLRFEKAIGKAKRWLGIESDCIFLNVGHQRVKVNLKDILYIEAMDNYVKIFRRDMPTLVSLITMKELLEMLPQGRFIRVHRSYIITESAVESIGTKGIKLSGVDKIIPIGRSYSSKCNTILKSGS